MSMLRTGFSFSAAVLAALAVVAAGVRAPQAVVEHQILNEQELYRQSQKVLLSAQGRNGNIKAGNEDDVYRVTGLLSRMRTKVTAGLGGIGKVNDTIESIYKTASAQGLEDLDTSLVDAAMATDRAELGRLRAYLQQGKTLLSTVRGILHMATGADSCADLECGEKATCGTDEKTNVVKCMCEPGFEGDGYLCTIKQAEASQAFLTDAARGVGPTGAAALKSTIGAKISEVALASSVSGGLVFAAYRDKETKLGYLRLGRHTLGQVFWPANTTGVLLHDKPVGKFDLAYDEGTKAVYCSFIEDATEAGYVVRSVATKSLESVEKLSLPLVKSEKPYGRSQKKKAKLLLLQSGPSAAPSDPGKALLVFYADDENKIGRVAVASTPSSDLSFDGQYDFYVGKVKYLAVLPVTTDKFVLAFRGSGNDGNAVARVGKMDADGNVFFYAPLKIGIAGADLVGHNLALVAANQVAIGYFSVDDGANRLSLLNVNATGNTLAVAAPSFYPYVVPNPKGASFRGPSLVGSEVSMPFVTPGAVPKVLTYYNPLEGQPGLSGSLAELCGVATLDSRLRGCRKIPFAGTRALKKAVATPVGAGRVLIVYLNQKGESFQELLSVEEEPAEDGATDNAAA